MENTVESHKRIIAGSQGLEPKATEVRVDGEVCEQEAPPCQCSQMGPFLLLVKQ